jgi:hypothetical protein
MLKTTNSTTIASRKVAIFVHMGFSSNEYENALLKGYEAS